MAIERERMSLEEIEALGETLKAQGLHRFVPRWGITGRLLLRGAGKPLRHIQGTDTDSELTEYQLEDGTTIWQMNVYGPDDIEGIAWFTDHHFLTSRALITRGEAIDDWLDRNRDAYEMFVPIKWSAAPDRARQAKIWLDQNRDRWAASPLAPIFLDLEAEIIAAIDADGEANGDDNG